MKKLPIYDNKDCLWILTEAPSRAIEVRAFLMLRFGQTPIQLTRLQKIPTNWVLTGNQRKAIEKAIEGDLFNIRPDSYTDLFDYATADLTHYTTLPITPMTLRYTYLLNILRQYHRARLIPNLREFGFCPRTARMMTLDILQDEPVQALCEQEPLDLSGYVFKDVK